MSATICKVFLLVSMECLTLSGHQVNQKAVMAPHDEVVSSALQQAIQRSEACRDCLKESLREAHAAHALKHDIAAGLSCTGCS